MTGRCAGRGDSHIMHSFQIVQAYGWIAWKRLRGFMTGNALRTRSAPEPLPAPPVGLAEDEGPRHLAVVGDSLAAGFGDPVPGLMLVGWADRLALALRQQCPHLGYTNLAIKGLTTSQIAAGQLAAVGALAPDLIILSAGGNDLLTWRWDPEAFRRSYTALLIGLIETGATVLTTTWHNLPLAVRMPAALAHHYSGRLAEASAIVREVSTALGAICVDFWQMPDLLDARCYSVDGTHPNARGYLRVAQVIAAAVSGQTGIALAAAALHHQAEHAACAAPRPFISRLWAYLGFGAPRWEVEA